jgi:predicted RNase H-like nuclease (RuvC/YqgF family)
MSKQPCSRKDMLKELKDSLQRINAVSERINSLTSTIERQQIERTSLQEECATLKGKVFNVMNELDVKSSNNTGYEERVMRFLSELLAVEEKR